MAYVHGRALPQAKLLRAILAYLYLAWIHPLGDGNGRTARLVEFQRLADAGFPTPACHRSVQDLHATWGTSSHSRATVAS